MCLPPLPPPLLGRRFLPLMLPHRTINHHFFVFSFSHSLSFSLFLSISLFLSHTRMLCNICSLARVCVYLLVPSCLWRALSCTVSVSVCTRPTCALRCEFVCVLVRCCLTRHPLPASTTTTPHQPPVSVRACVCTCMVGIGRRAEGVVGQHAAQQRERGGRPPSETAAGEGTGDAAARALHRRPLRVRLVRRAAALEIHRRRYGER